MYSGNRARAGRLEGRPKSLGGPEPSRVAGPPRTVLKPGGVMGVRAACSVQRAECRVQGACARCARSK